LTNENFQTRTNTLRDSGWAAEINPKPTFVFLRELREKPQCRLVRITGYGQGRLYFLNLLGTGDFPYTQKLTSGTMVKHKRVEIG